VIVGRLVLALVFAGTIAAGVKPVDRLQDFAFMIGSWTCTYTMGTQTSSYNATMSWAVGENWIHEHDTWTGGGDEGYYTYDPHKRQWTSTVLDSGRGTTVFVAGDSGNSRIVYHSVYPDTSMTDTIDRISPAKFTVHFSQTAGGKTTRSSDVCTKH
jgi:hypothetical protein